MNVDFNTLKQHTPHAQYEIVDVTFGNAYQDTEVRHSLKPPSPEHVDYVVLRQAQAATIYHDQTGTRKPWRDGVITLRSNIANARVTLLLTVSHEKRELVGTTPATVVATPASHTHVKADVTDFAHTHDAADVVSGVFDAARIPDLDASKIISGALDKARQHAQTAYKDEANVITANQSVQLASQYSAVKVGQVAGSLTYGGLSFNGSLASSAALLGFFGRGAPGSDATKLYAAVPTGGEFLWLVNGSSVASLNNAGTFAPTGGISTGAIAFPAVQVPQSGANILDDYEEGTWTPTITATGGGVPTGYANQYGYYTKIGRLVHITFAVGVTGVGSLSGSIEISGFPFLLAADTAHYAFGTLQFQGLAANWYSLWLLGMLNTTKGRLRGVSTAVGVTTHNATDLTNTDVTNGTNFYGSMIYTASQ